VTGLLAVALATFLLALAIVAPADAIDPFAAVATLGERRRHRARRRAGEASLVATLETMLAASRAGLVLREAIAVALDRARGELAERLRDALARETLGAGMGDAIADARRGAVGGIAALLTDLELCARARFPSERVAALAEDELGALRFARDLASDLHARTAGPRFQVWVLATIVPALALYLAAMSPTLAEELAAPIGRLVFIPGGVLFEIAGLVLSRRVVERACR
jgi:Flp pilus assembly protein TadB